jgi:hypothetical protein
MSRILRNITNVNVTRTGKSDDESLEKIKLQLFTLSLREYSKIGCLVL